MSIRLSAPSKTFLIGEYAVLRGGTALILNTTPRFELRAVRGEEHVRGIPEGSPAAGWLRQRSPLLRDWQIDFIDPHMGQGGFGASGAQFLLVHAFTTFLQSKAHRTRAQYDVGPLWNDFQVLSGGSGSGADVLAETVGDVAWVDARAGRAEARAWPFADLGFAIARTQHKIPTHEHLRDLPRAPLDRLVGLAEAGIEAFGHSAAFVPALQKYVEALEELGLQTESTQTLTRDLRAKSWCLLAKGCGALGADTVLVLFAQADRERALRELKNVVATDRDLSGGLGVEWGEP